MAKSIEKEWRTALTKSQYDALVAYFNLTQTTPVNQINYYFDTPNRTLIAQRCGLRVRMTNDTAELTLKQPIEQHMMIETTDTITQFEATKIISNALFPVGNVTKALVELGIELTDLNIIGSLENNRLECHEPDHIWVLDESIFPSNTTYELEFEFKDDDQPFWQLLEQFNINFEQLPTKMKRALTKG